MSTQRGDASPCARAHTPSPSLECEARNPHPGRSPHAAPSGKGIGTQPSLTAKALMAFVHLYQRTLGKLLGGHCRFAPTCSHYAIEALQLHGTCRGSWLIVRRVLRCHPFGGSGEDPVPPPRRSHD